MADTNTVPGQSGGGLIQSGPPLPNWVVQTGFVAGTVFVITILVLVISIPHPSGEQFWAFRVVLALGGAAFSMAITGYITVKLALPKKGEIVAGGALGVFVVLFFYAPHVPGIPTPPAYRIKEFSDDVDFTRWRSFGPADRKTSPVVRTCTVKVARVGPTDRDYEDGFSTSNQQDGMEFNALSSLVDAEIDSRSRNPPRQTWTLKVPRRHFDGDGTDVTFKYELHYWNNFTIDAPISTQNATSELSKWFPSYPVDHYTLSLKLPRPFQRIDLVRESDGKADGLQSFYNEKKLSVWSWDDHNLTSGTKLHFYIQLTPGSDQPLAPTTRPSGSI